MLFWGLIQSLLNSVERLSLISLALAQPPSEQYVWGKKRKSIYLYNCIGIPCFLFPKFIYSSMLNVLGVKIPFFPLVFSILPFSFSLLCTYQHCILLKEQDKWLFLQQTLIFVFDLSAQAVSKCGLHFPFLTKIIMSSPIKGLSSGLAM